MAGATSGVKMGGVTHDPPPRTLRHSGDSRAGMAAVPERVDRFCRSVAVREVNECQTGGLPKTAIRPVLNSTSGITVPSESKGNSGSLSAPAKRSSCARSTAMLSLFGEGSLTTVASEACAAQPSETKGRAYRRSLCDRLTPLLISFGLVRGTTPLSMRARSSQRTPAFAFYELDGGAVAARKADCLSLSDRPAGEAA